MQKTIIPKYPVLEDIEDYKCVQAALDIARKKLRENGYKKIRKRLYKKSSICEYMPDITLTDILTQERWDTQHPCVFAGERKESASKNQSYHWIVFNFYEFRDNKKQIKIMKKMLGIGTHEACYSIYVKSDNGVVRIVF